MVTTPSATANAKAPFILLKLDATVKYVYALNLTRWRVYITLAVRRFSSRKKLLLQKKKKPTMSFSFFELKYYLLSIFKNGRACEEKNCIHVLMICRKLYQRIFKVSL